MTARGLLNVALVLCAVALALVIYLKPGLESAESAHPSVSTLVPDEANEIHIERLEREALAFRKRDGGWQLVSQYPPLPAAQFQVSALLRILKTRPLSSYPADSLDLKELGLQPAQASVRINDFTIRFGITESLENSRYLQVGERVMLVQDQYQHLINADWSNFVARELLPGRPALTRLELPDLTLAPDADGRWQLSPEAAGISADAKQQLLDHWSHASALYVRRYNGVQTSEIVRIETDEENGHYEFTITAREPELVLARPELGIEYHFSGGMDKALLALESTPAEP